MGDTRRRWGWGHGAAHPNGQARDGLSKDVNWNQNLKVSGRLAGGDRAGVSATALRTERAWGLTLEARDR